MPYSLVAASIVALSAWLTNRGKVVASSFAWTAHASRRNMSGTEHSAQATRPLFESRVTVYSPSRPLFRGGLYSRKYGTCTRVYT